MKSVRSRRGDYSLCKSYFAIPDVLHVADKHNTTVSLSNPSKQRSTPVTPRAYSNVASCAASVRLNVTLGDTDDLEYLDETVEKRLLNETSSVWSSFITPSRRTRSRRSLFRNLSLLKKRKPKDYGSSSVDFFNRHSDPFQCGCRKCKDAVFDYTKSLVVLDRLSSPWAAAWPPSKRFLKANDSPPQQQSPLRRSRSGRYKRRSAIFGPKPKRDDAFVNSQEWTMSRSVYELKLVCSSFQIRFFRFQIATITHVYYHQLKIFSIINSVLLFIVPHFHRQFFRPSLAMTTTCDFPRMFICFAFVSYCNLR
ncbi:hypothetical protein AB6A40_007040 [Gnathostoma spinigerum]|uniref:Uncharacterized protein n=1 Tax=Gnathostoma spinigerum TaxID=75299 RepID=A0ABD6EKP2_9BILA